MTIEDDIKIWALQRPAWQQEVLVALARGESLEPPDRIAHLADRILQPGSEKPNGAAAGIVLGNIEAKQVRLTSVGNLKGVNALAEEQTLSFAPDGLTLIYGNNGSGKSGYARLVKGMVSARHFSKVLPDVFQDGAPEPSAELAYQVDGESASEKVPAVDPVDDLQRIRFYDEQCGDEYTSHESTVTYRPSSLTLLDGLIEVCDRVRTELQGRITENEQKRLSLHISPETVAGAFLAKLSDKTTDSDIDQATALPSNASDRLGDAQREVARMEASDSSKEQIRLRDAARDTVQLRARLTELTAGVSDERLAAIQQLKEDAAAKRDAAKLAASITFEDEPLQGVGSQTWRALWEAARAYATAEVSPGHGHSLDKEITRCVLCQQHLDNTAKQRFERFNQYMTATTQRDATRAERAYTNALDELRTLDFATQQTTSALATVLANDADLARAVRERLGALEGQRDKALNYFENDHPAVQPLPASDNEVKLDRLAASLGSKASDTDVDGFKRSLAAARRTLDELRAAHALAESRSLLKGEVARLRVLAQLRAGRQQTDTKGITRKSTDLTAEYATRQIVDQFTRETQRMSLQKVTLQDRGGQKGKVNQIPALLGTRHKDAQTPAVLSEGEQTVLGLAGFFTEAVFDGTKSALVLDDPVTSLDHVRRDKVAERLAEFALERQVIVFTHDVAFVAELLTALGAAGAAVVSKSIMRKGAVPGYCSDGFPWKAQDIDQRMGTIHNELQRLKNDRTALDDDAYEKRVNDIAGMLSETWERTVTSEIVNKVYDRSASQVRPMMVRMLAKITEEDNHDYQVGYGHTSKWALRHDKAEETNYVPPEPTDIEDEYNRLRTWRRRIKSYQN